MGGPVPIGGGVVKRGGPLKRTRRLKTASPIKRSGSLERAARKRKPVRDTGPSAAVRKLVLEREGMQCAACGRSVTGRPFSIQHRRARGMGGGAGREANQPSNLVLLCGSATSPGGCHLACENRDPDMRGRGFWVYSWENPEAVPVLLASEHDSGRIVWLDNSGEYAFAPPDEVAA